MRAIFIDVRNRCVEEIDLEPGIEPIYKKLECEIFAAVYPQSEEEYPNTNLYVDDETLLKQVNFLPGAFFIDMFPAQPLFGHGLIVGYDYDLGTRIDCTLSVQEVADMIRFLDEDEIIMYHEHLNNINNSQFPISI